MVRLSPTGLGAKGALFFATVVLLFLATPYSNLFFLLTAFLAVLGVVGVVGAIANLRGVDATVLRIEPAPAGGCHAVELRLASRRRVFGLSAWLELDGRTHEVAHATVATDGQLLLGQLTDLPRGVRRLDGVRLRSRHPFGIVRTEVRRPAGTGAADVVTHPAPVAGSQAARDALAGLDAIGRHRAGDESIAGLREWRAGDAWRGIHWKASARRGAPIVKELEAPSGSALAIVVDCRCAADDLETALSSATAVLLAAAERQLPVRLCSQGFDATHDRDHPRLADCLRWLAAATPLPLDDTPPPQVHTAVVALPDRDGGIA